MTNLGILDLRDNQLSNLTLPPDLTKLTALFVDGNPLTTFVSSEPLATTNLAATVPPEESRRLRVHLPLTIQLVQLRILAEHSSWK